MGSFRRKVVGYGGQGAVAIRLTLEEWGGGKWGDGT